MPGQRPDGLRVALAPGDAFIESTDVAMRLASPQEADRVGGFDERPLEVAVDVRAEPTEASLAAAGVDAGRRARIGGQFLGGGESRDVAHLERDHDPRG
jgi:hypothetical protein